MAWNLNDTTPGTGEKPAWFKAEKYKNVSEQAKAYTELEKTLGAFVGAPKDDKGQPKAYELKLPEGVTVDMTHPTMKGSHRLGGREQRQQRQVQRTS